MPDGFVITGSLIIVCKTKDGKPPRDGGQTLSFAEIDIGRPQKGLTVFTDLDLAERYIKGMKIVGCYPLEFEGPEFANFLETDGRIWTHLAIDPTTELNRIQVIIAAADLLKTIRSKEST